MGEGESKDQGADAADLGSERRADQPTREGKPGRRPKSKAPEPDAVETQWEVIRHYFPDFLEWLRSVEDPRKNPERCTYPIEYIMILALMMFCGQCGSRRQLGRELNGGKRFGGNIWRLIGKKYAEINCHPDTMNNVISLIDPDELEKLITQVVDKLRKSRVLDRLKFDGKYIVAVDGTKLLGFNKRHCEHCTHTTINGRTIYHHYVLAAKIVTPIGLVIPLAFEFVENPGGEYDKQDCEIKAFRRLVEKIEKLYPRLPINLLADGLYAEEKTLNLGENHNWNLIITLTEKKLPSVTTQLPEDGEGWPGTRTIKVIHDGELIIRHLRWKTPVKYHGKIFHVIEMEDVNEKGERLYYNRWITNVKPDKTIIHDPARAGRLRWKIENEGINTQKTDGCEMEHGDGLKGNP